MNRRKFLEMLGIGTAVAVVAPSVLTKPALAKPAFNPIATQYSRDINGCGKGISGAVDVMQDLDKLHAQLMENCHRHTLNAYSYVPTHS